jgi:AbrB family looped-hinge helix DNA binding protein
VRKTAPAVVEPDYPAQREPSYDSNRERTIPAMRRPYVARAKLSTRGQVTIPKRIRQRLGLKPGDQIDFVPDRRGVRLQKDVPAAPFRKYRGYLKTLAGSDPDDLVDGMRGQ